MTHTLRALDVLVASFLALLALVMIVSAVVFLRAVIRSGGW